MEGKRICKSTAKVQYKLTEKDLAGIECYTVPNPRYRRGPEMTLFDEEDLIKAFCVKHSIEPKDIDSTLKCIDREKEERKTKRLIAANKKKDKRRKELTDALAQYDLIIRNDSSLCKGYIDGTITNWTVDEVVNRVAQCRFLFDYCDMKRHLDDVHEQRKEERQQLYEEKRRFRESGDEWDSDMETEEGDPFDDAERRALRSVGGYPDVWPWMEEDDNDDQKDLAFLL